MLTEEQNEELSKLYGRLYQVKFYNGNDAVYGIANQYSPKAWELRNEGLYIEDAISPAYHVVERNKLVAIETKFGHYNRSTNTFEDCDEYHKFVETEQKKAEAISDALPDGVHVGSLFSVGVADGAAWYVVTKVNKKTCKIEWRGFCMDRWVDQRYGWGKTVPISEIEMFVRRIKALHGIR